MENADEISWQIFWKQRSYLFGKDLKKNSSI
jgi:hypothetical protein